MPKFSIIIPAYNSAPYLEHCLSSIKSQSVEDWEAVIVVDGSPDNSLEVSEALAAQDSRVKVVDKQQNEGIHRARITGMENASGEYTFFLDADDELHEGFFEKVIALNLESDVDIVHLGINVINCGLPEDEVSAFESYINKPVEPLQGKEICEAAYAPSKGFIQDWRFTQRLYRTELLKELATKLVRERLGRNEDGYEYFVASCLAHREVTHNDIVALDYYYGRGLNSSALLTAEQFSKTAHEFNSCLEAIQEFAAGFDGFDTTEVVRGSCDKAVDLLLNDWHMRVADEDKHAAAQYAAEVFGASAIATQLMRLARDVAYAKWVNGGNIDENAPCMQWFHWAEELAGSTGESAVESASTEVGASNSGLPAEYFSMRDAARRLLNDLECRSSWASTTAQDAPSLVMRSAYEAQPIRIFVTAHKDVDIFHNNTYQPVQVGALSNRRRLLWAYQDDTGSNIANLNPMYCELTTQYWAWKNVAMTGAVEEATLDAEVAASATKTGAATTPNYLGFCHYRRYFDFSPKNRRENPYGEVMAGTIGWDGLDRYNFHDEQIQAAVEGWDIVTTGIKNIRKFPEKFTSIYDHYNRAPYLHIEDLNKVIEILKDMYPDYAQDADNYLSGTRTCFCNMYIMRTELFNSYCEWMFPILERFCEGWDTAGLSHETLRTPGHLSERLFNIWLVHQKRTNPALKHKEVQCIHFEHPEHTAEPELAPAFEGELAGKGEATDTDGTAAGAASTKPVVPIVFAADNNYVPMVTTTIYSMLKSASSEALYDIVIFERDFSPENKQLMQEFFAQFANVSLRFANVSSVIKAYNLQTNNDHISEETFYRFLVQRVLPSYNKVLYLDSDLIIKGDVLELYNTELGTNLIAAARDIDYLGNLDIKGEGRMAYSKDVLHLANPYGYFQAGVLVLNTAELRRLHSVDEWLKIASNSKYIYDDQDILNAECQGRVVYLENAWNVMNDCGGRIKKVFSFAPAAIYDAFMAAYKAPKIVHYAGFEKPWKPGPCDQAELYWLYARETPFYETLLAMRQPVDTVVRAKRKLKRIAKHLKEGYYIKNFVRKVGNMLLPQGSSRRAKVKALLGK